MTTKVTSQLLAALSGLTALSPAQLDPASDLVLVWDDSAGTFKKMSATEIGAKVLLSSQTAANVSALTFTGLTGYRRYRFEFEKVVPVTGGSHLLMQASTDGGATWLGSTWHWARFNANDGSGSGANGSVADSSYNLAAIGIHTDPNHGITGWVESDDLAASQCHTFTSVWGGTDNGGSIFSGFSTGRYITAANVMNAVKFFFSAGNINLGTIRCYGLR